MNTDSSVCCLQNWFTFCKVSDSDTLLTCQCIAVNDKSGNDSLMFQSIVGFCLFHNVHGQIYNLRRQAAPMMSHQEQQLSEPPLKRIKTGAEYFSVDFSNVFHVMVMSMMSYLR